MSNFPPSRKPAVAGVIAGLLAVSAGAWYLSSHHLIPAPVATQPAPAPLAAAIAPSSSAAVSRQQAVEKLMALPELKAWADGIEQRSGGKLRGALIEYDQHPRDVSGQPHYQFSFVENGEDSVQAWESFLVSHARGDILVEDDISGELMSLEQWRKDKQPMQRNSAAKE